MRGEVGRGEMIGVETNGTKVKGCAESGERDREKRAI